MNSKTRRRNFYRTDGCVTNFEKKEYNKNNNVMDFFFNNSFDNTA